MFLVWGQLVEDGERVGGFSNDHLQLTQRRPPLVLVLSLQLGVSLKRGFTVDRT